MIAIGTIIPDGIYEAYHEEKIRTVTLKEFRGQWLMLLFYPRDVPVVCPSELAETARLYSEFRKLGAVVCGVSTDSAHVHQAWHASSPAGRSVGFPLIGDRTGALSREFGVYLEEQRIALRGTFLIDPDGVLWAYEVHDKSSGLHVGKMLQKLQAAVRLRWEEGRIHLAGMQPADQAAEPRLRSDRPTLSGIAGEAVPSATLGTRNDVEGGPQAAFDGPVHIALPA